MSRNEAKNIILIVLGSVFYYLLSFLGHKIPFINTAGFLAISIAIFLLSVKKFELALGLAFLELILSSFGRMFYLDISGLQISLRTAIFVMVVGIWFSRQLTARRIWYYLPLFIAVLWGIARGILSRNNFDNIFSDANGFLFFGYLGPAIEAIKKAGWGKAKLVLAGGIIALWIMTMFSAVGFSNGLFETGDGFYKWIRDSRLGEITFVNAQFSRVFFQSHIFALFGFFLFGYCAACEPKSAADLSISILSASIIWVGLSRSFWVGGAAGLIILTILSWRAALNKRVIVLPLLTLLSGLMLSSILIPSLLRVVFARGTESAEPAADARRALLPPLFQEIKKNPILGTGFGAAITYKTTDPRALRQNPNGEVTTYAFEWGWLDLWLKMGLLGVLAYIWLIFCVLKRLYKASDENKPLAYGLFAAIIALLVTHTFSPYLNHPLGIGLLLLADAIAENA